MNIVKDLTPRKSDFQKNLFGKSKLLTNRNLYSFHKEAMSWKQLPSLFYLLYEDDLKEKIDRFYKHNSEKINIIILEIKNLNAEYFQHEDGKIKYDDKNIPLMNEGKAMADYDEKYNALMNQPCNVKY